MYILSDYKDYYDSMAFAYGIDKKITFNRKQHEIQIGYEKFEPIVRQCISLFPKYKSYRNTSPFFEVKILYFCGKIFYVSYITTYDYNKHTIEDINIEIFDDLTEYSTILENLGYKKHLNFFISKIQFILSDIESIINKIKNYTDKNYSELDLPYFLISTGTNHFTVSIPILKDIKFNLLIDNSICYQMIEMDINKKYNIEKTINIDDKYKISQYGFDNNSFKTRK